MCLLLARVGEVNLKAGKLLPGESEELSVFWDTRGRQGDTSTFISVIYVAEDGTQQALHIDLKGRISEKQ